MPLLHKEIHDISLKIKTKKSTFQILNWHQSIKGQHLQPLIDQSLLSDH